jgi:hypothetical protein
MFTMIPDCQASHRARMREERAEIDDNFGPKEQQYLAEETACQARQTLSTCNPTLHSHII